MEETYKKVGDDLEITRTMDEAGLLREKVRADQDLVRASARVDKVDAKLAVINAAG